MAFLSEVAVKIGLDTSGVQKGLKDVETSTGGLKSALGGVAKIVAGAFAVEKIIEFGKKSLEMASEVEEMENKFNVVFKNTSKDVDEWSATLGKAIGRNKNEIKGAVANIGDLFSGFGMTEEAAGKLSESAVKLSYDLASFNNVEDADAIQSVQSALLGEHDAVKKLGIAINDATLSEAMHQMGIKKKWNELDEATKAQVRYQVMINQTKNAQGDAERSAGGFANSLKRLKANVEGIYEGIGKLLLPIATMVVKALADGATAVSGFISGLSSGNVSGFASALAPIAPLFSSIVDTLSGFGTVIGNIAVQLGNTMWQDFIVIAGQLKDVFFNIIPIVASLADTLVNVLGTALTIALGALSYVWDIVNLVVQVFLDLVNAILTNCAPAIQMISDVWNRLATTILNFWNNTLSPFISAFVEYLYTFWADNSGTLNKIGEVWGVVFNAIADVVKWLVGIIQTYIVPFFSWLVGIVSDNLGNIFGIFQGAFDMIGGILDIFIGIFTGNWSKVWEGVKSVASGAWEMLKGGFMTLVSVIGNIVSSIGKVIWAPFEWAWDKLSGFVQGIKDWFGNLFPKIKLPHFKFSGSLNPIDWISGGLPKLSIDWYATGGIATGPSVVGVGEAGDEAIVPLSNKSRMRPFAEAVSGMINQDKGDKNSGGALIIKVESLVVREEADINRIAERLYKLQRKNQRAKGGLSYGY